jgi:hypothetical protein
MKNLTFVWTTHRNDGLCCIHSVRSVLRLGIDPAMCFVGEHVGKELVPHHRKIFARWGVALVPSRYTRKNTYADLKGRVELLVRHGAEWVYNLDSDTLLNRLDEIEDMQDSEYVAMAGAAEQYSFAGSASMYRVDALRVVLNDITTENSLKLASTGVVDDQVTGALLDNHFGRHRVLRRPAAYLKHWMYLRETETMEQVRRNYAAVTFGQRTLARALAKGRPVRDAVADTMRDFISSTGAPPS